MQQETRYWIGVAAKAHVERGVAGAFCMFSHGRHDAVKRVRPGDWIAYYAPRTELEGGDAVRAFTAIGCVAEGEPYEAEMGAGRAGCGAMCITRKDATPTSIRCFRGFPSSKTPRIGAWPSAAACSPYRATTSR